MPTPFNPLPAPGDIVWCHFPEGLGTPGPKPRPALIIAVSRDDHAVQLAYGTSQKTYKIYPGEFALDPNDAGFSDSGLDRRTKFDLNRIVQLPFNSIWFTLSPSSTPQTPLPKMGVLHPSYIKAAQKAKAQAKNHNF